jgi:CubicO group peptidase (beta-lactamase class C family)
MLEIGRVAPDNNRARRKLSFQILQSMLPKFAFMMIVVASAVSAFAHAEHPAAELIAAVENALPESPGACVLAINDGQVVLKQGFGVADVESRDPCTPATNFRMASVSKQFTATAVLMLVDRGQLSLDDTLDRFFPGFSKYGEKITVRHLLTHTSGLPDYEELVPDGTTLQLDDLAVVQLLMETSEPLFPAGEKWQYSNSGFVVLGMIVEIAAHKPFHEFMADEIFRSLEMDNTLLYQRGLNDVKHRAFGHERKDDEWIRADQSVTSATRGDGVVYTSLEDYQKWLTAHYENKLLSPESHKAMFSPQVKTDRGESHYGYGWFLDEFRGTRRIFHNGDTRGFRLCVQTFPDRKAAVVLQFNGEVPEEMTKVGERLADLLIFDRQPD